MADFESIPYRIRIGVTGHRKLDNPAAVQALVKKAIDAEVEKLFPEESRRNIERVRRAGTTAISFCVLSPLPDRVCWLSTSLRLEVRMDPSADGDEAAALRPNVYRLI